MNSLPPPYSNAVWGICFILSMLGAGGLLLRILCPKQQVNAGVMLALGLCGWIVVGGALMATSIVSPPLLTIGVGLTSLIGCGELWKRRSDIQGMSAASKNNRKVLAMIVLMVIPAYIAGVISRDVVPWDDFSAYFSYAAEILHRGTLVEPFGFRALASYGGQSFLHALLLVGASVTDLAFLEKGLLPVLCALIWALQFYALTGKRRFLSFFVISFLCYHLFSAGNSSVFSGIAVFSALALLFPVINHQPSSYWRNSLLLALPLSAAMALRPTYLVPAVVWIAIFVLGTQAFVGKARMRMFLQIALLSFILLIPWIYLALKNFNTPLYPLFQGHANPLWKNLFTARSFRDFIVFLWYLVTSSKSDYQKLIPLVAFLSCINLKGFPAFPKVLLMGTLASLMLLTWKSTYFEPHEFERYTIGFVLPSLLLWIHSFCAMKATSFSGRTTSLSIMVSIALVIIFTPSVFLGAEEVIELNFIAGQGFRREVDPYRIPHTLYERLQKSVPVGDPFIAMVDYPLIFDYARNPIDSLDLAGAVSPAPGIESITTPAGMVGYFRGLGYRWFATVSPRKSEGLYGLFLWKRRARIPWDPARDRPELGRTWQTIGKTISTVLEIAEDIPNGCQVIFNEKGLSMIDLAHCHFSPDGFSSQKKTF